MFFAASGKWQLPLAVLATVALLVASVTGWRRIGPGFRSVSIAAIAALAAAVVTLATTAVFTVHLQLLAYPSALGCATLVVALRRAWRPLAIVAATTCIAFAVRASLGQADLSTLSARTWTIAPVSTPGTALEATRVRLFPDVTRCALCGVRPQHGGRPRGLCRPIDRSPLPLLPSVPLLSGDPAPGTIDCARREKPELILVTTSFYDPMPGRPAWESFVTETRAMLRARYELVTREGMTEVWRLRRASIGST